MPQPGESADARKPCGPPGGMCFSGSPLPFRPRGHRHSLGARCKASARGHRRISDAKVKGFGFGCRTPASTFAASSHVRFQAERERAPLAAPLAAPLRPWMWSFASPAKCRSFPCRNLSRTSAAVRGPCDPIASEVETIESLLRFNPQERATVEEAKF